MVLTCATCSELPSNTTAMIYIDCSVLIQSSAALNWFGNFTSALVYTLTVRDSTNKGSRNKTMNTLNRLHKSMKLVMKELPRQIGPFVMKIDILI